MDEFSKHFTGVALQLKPSDDFKQKVSIPVLSINDLLGRVQGFGMAMGQVLFFALLLELLGLAMPLLGQLIADDVLPNTDYSLLSVLGLGFTFLVLILAVINYAKDWALSLVSLGLKAQVSERVFRHALRLPPQFFERRQSADISSRFDSLTFIERALAGRFVGALLDGGFALLIVGVLFTYSFGLGFVVITGLAAYSVIRWLTYGPMRELEMRIVEALARQTGSLLETLRAIVPIQLANKTSWRLAQWSVHLAEGTNAELKLAKANAFLSGSRSAVQGLVTVCFAWVAANLALKGHLSLGALFAVLAYQQIALGRLIQFVEHMLSIRMLSVHLERLSDIVFTQPQIINAGGTMSGGSDEITITVNNVRFRYSPSDPEILKGVNLTINAGEHLALTGPSGCGKTTLMKLMLGILEPTEGEILFNGKNIKDFGLERQRAITAAVLQDDTLFYGTIKDNISFFDSEASNEKIVKSAMIAGIHADIVAMPLNYFGLVGEGSGTLSGGQRQRLLLARAVYREPKVLMLDEATSHLDLINEKQVNEGVAGLKATRVSIAHRTDSLLAAQRIVILEDGKVSQDLVPETFSQLLQAEKATQAK